MERNNEILPIKRQDFTLLLVSSFLYALKGPVKLAMTALEWAKNWGQLLDSDQRTLLIQEIDLAESLWSLEDPWHTVRSILFTQNILEETKEEGQY